MDVPRIDLWSNGAPEPIDVARTVASERERIETPFYVIDLDDVSLKLNLWREVLPRIMPHYGALDSSTKRNAIRVISLKS